MRRAVKIAGVALLLGHAACMSDADGGSIDAGAMSDREAGGPEADAGADDGGPVAGADAGVPSPGRAEFDELAADASEARAACFDGIDNDGDGVYDCADASCQRNVRSCCVGRASGACCTDGEEQTLTATGCVGPLADCAIAGVPFATFGAPGPIARELDGVPVVLPGGRESDAGAVLSRALDPRAGALRLEARIAAPLDGGAPEGVEAVGVGLIDARIDVTQLSRPVPIAGLIVSRDRGEVLLVVAGDVVHRAPLTTDAAVDYTLELAPTGEVRLSSTPSVIEASARVAYTSSLRALVYGRTADPAAVAPARLERLRVVPSVCDIPSALDRPSAPSVPAPAADPSWASVHGLIGEPDVLRYVDVRGEPQVRMALMVDGELHLAVPGAGGFVLTHPIGEPPLARPTVPWAADGVSDPALLYRADRLEVLFTGWASGRGTIGRAIYDDGLEAFGAPLEVAGLEATELASFRAAETFEIHGTLHVVVRVDDGTTHRLALYRLTGAAEHLADLHAPRTDDTFAFDRDEIDGPAVLLRDGVFRLYYAGRRGTRWSLGMLVSDDGTSFWHEPVGVPVLGPSGRGLDALGVRDPAFDDDGTRLRVYYAADDGRVIRIAAASTR